MLFFLVVHCFFVLRAYVYVYVYVCVCVSGSCCGVWMFGFAGGLGTIELKSQLIIAVLHSY